MKEMKLYRYAHFRKANLSFPKPSKNVSDRTKMVLYYHIFLHIACYSDNPHLFLKINSHTTHTLR